MTYATPVTLVQPCPPHEWARMPTVGGFHCFKCQRTVMFNEPDYGEIEAARAALAPRPVQQQEDKV